MHHDLAWSLNLLEAVQRDVIEVACAIEVSLLVAHDLLEEVVSTSFSLFLLQQQVVGRCDLVVLVVLNIRYSLI